jgi:hypothetical protein
MTLPAAGYISNASRTVAEQKTALEDLRDAVADQLGGAARESLTIASGAVVPGDGTSGGVIVVDTEAAAATDDLTNITTTNTPNGRLLLVYAANSARVVTVKHNAGGTGQIQLTDGADFVLDALDKWVLLQLRSTTWVEILRSYGEDFPAAQDYARIAAVPAHNVLCPHQRLVIDYATAATLTIAADAVVLADSGGRLKRFASLSETLTISSTGANGRDVVDNGGAEEASVWYHLFAIGKADGTLDVFASQVGYPGSATSVYTRLPAGYTYAGYIGAVYNDSGFDLRELYQRGNVGAMTYDGTPILSGGSATTLTPISLVTEIPITATGVFVDFLAQQATTTTSTRAYVASGGSGTTYTGTYLIAEAVGASTSLMRARQGGEILLTTPQEVKYFVASGSTCSLNATGWRF